MVQRRWHQLQTHLYSTTIQMHRYVTSKTFTTAKKSFKFLERRSKIVSTFYIQLLVGEFVTESLQVPSKCHFGHVTGRTSCNDYSHCNLKAESECKQNVED